jgi:drug/metabolite transporter (DMT)-like permease
MSSAFGFLVVGLLSFAAMGVIHKIGDRLEAEALPIALYAVVTAGLLSAVVAVSTHTLSAHHLPQPILLIALPFGASAGLALWFFQKGLRYGRIATSWLMINLSAGIPTVLSIVVYREAIGWKKASALLLILAALLLLWWDRRVDSNRSQKLTELSTTEVL